MQYAQQHLWSLINYEGWPFMVVRWWKFLFLMNPTSCWTFSSILATSGTPRKKCILWSVEIGQYCSNRAYKSQTSDVSVFWTSHWLRWNTGRPLFEPIFVRNWILECRGSLAMLSPSDSLIHAALRLWLELITKTILVLSTAGRWTSPLCNPDRLDRKPAVI